MSQAHPDLAQLAELTTKLYLDILRRGTMDGRDSEGNIIQVPISAAMMGKIQDWLKAHAVTMDASPESGSSIAQIAANLKARGFTGKLADDEPEEDAA